MRPGLLALLRCPVSRARLELEEPVWDDVRGHVVTGTLASPEGRRYAILGGIPDLHAEYRSGDEAATVRAFGEEWARYDDFEGYMGSPELFADFLGLEAEAFRDRTVLEVGCGAGRWLKVIAALGAREVVGVDLSTAVVQAYRRTAHLPNVHVVRGSAFALPLSRQFDLVVSIGVIHHLDDPVAALREIRNAVQPDHRVAIWVYAAEGNELYLRLVQPLRRLGPRLPPGLLAPVSRALALPLWLHVHTLNRWALRGGWPLPLTRYLDVLRRLRFRDVESVVYDQLTPRIARYASREEVLGWIHAGGGEVTHLYHRAGNSWQCHFRYPAPGGRWGDERSEKGSATRPDVAEACESSVQEVQRPRG